MRAVFVERGLGAGERHAVVAGGHDDRVVQFSHGLERAQHGSELRVEPLHFDEVIEKVVTHHRRIRQERRDSDTVRVLACLNPRAGLVGAVRFGGAEPEAERRVFGPLLEKDLEIRGVVQLLDALRGDGTKLPAAVFRACGIALPPAALPVARPPALAREADVIPSFFKQIRENREGIREQTAVGPGLRQLPDVPARERGCAVGRTLRRSREGVMEKAPLLGDAIKGRGVDARRAIHRSMGPGPVIRDGKQDVGALLPWRSGCLRACALRGSQKPEDARGGLFEETASTDGSHEALLHGDRPAVLAPISGKTARTPFVWQASCTRARA